MTRMLMSSKNDDNDDDNDELFEPAQNVVASFVEWSCAIEITTTPLRCTIDSCTIISTH